MARTVINENSKGFLTASFFDEDGDAAAPSTGQRWRKPVAGGAFRQIASSSTPSTRMSSEVRTARSSEPGLPARAGTCATAPRGKVARNKANVARGLSGPILILVDALILLNVFPFVTTLSLNATIYP